MKIILDKESYIEVKSDLTGKLNLIFKTKSGNDNTFVSSKLNAEQLNELIKALVSEKIKVK